MNYFLGIDVGTTGCKAILVDENGELIAKGVEEYPFILHVPTGRNKILLIGGREPNKLSKKPLIQFLLIEKLSLVLV